MLSTTLTNNRVINEAVVKYKIDNNYYLTIQIEGNHLIAIDTYCKINITGLDVVNNFKDYSSNNVLTDIFNGTKTFKATTSTTLEVVINIAHYYSPVFFEVISGTPVITTANESWDIDVSTVRKYNCKLINSGIENFNGALIEVFATKSNGLIGDSDYYNNGTNGIRSLHETYLNFIGYQTATFKIYNSPNALTNIPIIIEAL
jgi:hypothetical protein